MGEGREREHSGGVLGIAFGLTVLFGSVLVLVFMLLPLWFGGGIKGGGQLEELFGEAGPPFDLELAQASRLPTGELVLRLTRPEAPSPAEILPDVEDPEAAQVDPSDEGLEGLEPEDRMLAAGMRRAGEPRPGPPEEVILILYRSPGAVTRLFQQEESSQGRRDGGGGGHGGPRRDPRHDDSALRGASATLMAWEKDPSFAWHTTIERDEIAWSRWRANMLVERSFHEGGGWRDSARVNLCQPGRSLVLFAQWPEETPVDQDELRRLLRAIRMLEPDEDEQA